MRIAKKAVLAEIITASREIIGEVFLSPGQRFIDLMNDDRRFIPLRIADEDVLAIAKSSIIEARPLAVKQTGTADPYQILKMPRTASNEEIRAAWVKRAKACHPDRFAAMEIDEAIIYEARKAMQRINIAYEQIISERRAAAADAQPVDKRV